RSMQAEDVKPTRLRAAKTLLTDLVHQDIKNRFGVIGFTTNAIVLSPLTNDAELLTYLFKGVDETLIMTKGSAIMPALELSRKMSHAASPILFLLTDGGDKDDYSEEAMFAKQNGLIVNVLMLASLSGSTLKGWDGTLLKGENGDIVITSQNRAIKILSTMTGGVYIDGADLSKVQEVIAAQSDNAYKSKTKMVQYEELFYYFIALGLLFFMFSATTLFSNLQKLLRRRSLR
ncbi:MAG: VWA domain-containing protein, partial [Epsilonproteobacteria bacterium]